MSLRETIRIRLETEDLSNEALVRTLAPGLPMIIQGDKLKVTYDLNFDYIGNIYEQLTAIEKLLDSPNVIGHADMKNIAGGKILLQQIIRKLDRVADLLS